MAPLVIFCSGLIIGSLLGFLAAGLLKMGGAEEAYRPQPVEASERQLIHR